MARVKPKRHGVVTDMTAMCDVAFLPLSLENLMWSRLHRHLLYQRLYCLIQVL